MSIYFLFTLRYSKIDEEKIFFCAIFSQIMFTIKETIIIESYILLKRQLLKAIHV